MTEAELQKEIEAEALAKPGNADEYKMDDVQANPDSKIRGKKIIFLGSSVTVGYASFNESFVHYAAKKCGIEYILEAISGTTLVDTPRNGNDSYVTRMKGIDKSYPADLFLCQLSTNDATNKKPLGEIAEGFDKEKFDVLTITGAMEYVIAYARETWGCKVAFYTGTKYGSPEYEAMVARLLELKEKWGIDVLDLWNDPEMNAVSKSDYDLYMFDPIHPCKAGYKLWWGPKFVKFFEEIL